MANEEFINPTSDEPVEVDPMLREFDPGANDESFGDELVDAFSEFGKEVVDTVKDIPSSIKEFGEDVKEHFSHHDAPEESSDE